MYLTLPYVDKTDIDISLARRIIPKGISSSSFQRAWNDGLTGEGVIVAVLDTGIDATHQDLKGKILKSYNLTGEMLLESHGTHVAGTIAAEGTLIGGAKGCKILDIKIIGKKGASIPSIVRGITIAVQNGASVVNMSLGGSNLSKKDIDSLSNAVEYAWNSGCIVIAASGNSGISTGTPDSYNYPASVDKVISVGACIVPESLQVTSLAKFSNENSKVDAAACGVDVISTIIGGNYAIYSGTSMATPHVSAIACLLAQKIKAETPSLSGAMLSSSLVERLYSNLYQIGPCNDVVYNGKYLIKTTCSNISFGKGFCRYDSEKGPYIPDGQRYYEGAKFLGHIL